MKGVHFKPRPGKRLTKEQAERYGGFIYAMGRRRKRGVTPEELVDLASDPENPCHDAFEWEDGAAAREYRLIQARTLLRSFVVVYEDPETGEAVEDVGMHRVPVQGRSKEERSFAYVPVEQVAQEEESLAHVLAEYRARLRSIARDMEACERFASILGASVSHVKAAIEALEAAETVAA